MTSASSVLSPIALFLDMKMATWMYSVHRLKHKKDTETSCLQSFVHETYSDFKLMAITKSFCVKQKMCKITNIHNTEDKTRLIVLNIIQYLCFKVYLKLSHLLSCNAFIWNCIEYSEVSWTYLYILVVFDSCRLSVLSCALYSTCIPVNSTICLFLSVCENQSVPQSSPPAV